ncbi:MAG: AgmX/PglI C-terminal domain-containing protein [Sandaracinaceae bacterium]|nr:MAG: AgmX/PglI C-terminal domain-containing protein [Sandaracinaceae bacterium]
MTAVMRAVQPVASGPRWVRFAVVRDGRIELEGVRGPDQEVVVGPEGQVPIAVSKAGPPLSLLSFRDGAWRLKVREAWTGRTSRGDLADAEARGGFRELKLEGEGRAKVVIGDVSVLVQLVDRPPARSKPQLPSSLKRGLMGGTDWTFTSFVAASFLLHFALVVFVVEADWPVERQLIPSRHIEWIVAELPPPDDAPTIADADDPVADDAPEVADDLPSEPTETVDRPRHASAPSSVREGSADTRPTVDHDAVAREAARQVDALLLGATGDIGSAFDALRNGAPTGEAADLLRHADGVRVASNDVGQIEEREGRGPPGGGLGPQPLSGLRRGAIEEQGPSEPLRERVVTVVRPPSGPGWIPDPIDPTFDPRELHRALRARMGAVRACYEGELTHGNPNLSGRIQVGLTVQPMGNLSGVRVVENSTGSESLGACVVRAVSRVRLRRGPSSPLQAEYPMVFARQD